MEPQNQQRFFTERDLKETIERLFNSVCEAFARSDAAGAAIYFSDRPEMLKISNGNVLNGKEQMIAYWEKKIKDLNGMAITIHINALHRINDDYLWMVADEYISSPNSQTKAVFTNLLIWEDNQWKILLDHTTYLNP
ncbi:MAG TPA: nuclear transport factor 2 family protein [Negativicutes bacterium]|nr:nuclear transport factor 2 family protein [Negativicutes bacterium]